MEQQQSLLCKAITVKGTPCRVKARQGTDYCFGHSPEFAERRKQITYNAGRALKKPLKFTRQNFKVRDAKDIQRFTAKFIEDVATGKLDSSASVIKVLPQMLKTFLDAQDRVSNDRILKLETKLRELQQQKKT